MADPTELVIATENVNGRRGGTLYEALSHERMQDGEYMTIGSANEGDTSKHQAGQQDTNKKIDNIEKKLADQTKYLNILKLISVILASTVVIASVTFGVQIHELMGRIKDPENTFGTNSTKLSTCHDEFNDCAVANRTTGICGLQSYARKMCAKYCGLCSIQDGQWATWSDWTICSVSCDNGTWSRTRTCTDPAPANGGKYCIGSNTDTGMCHLRDCPVHGDWGTWAHWTTCSASCGQGITHRLRSCTNPRPALLGNPCFGDSKDYALCLIKQCPVDGKWTDWLQWSPCSVTCGSGHMTRQRQCLKPMPSNGGRNCVGSSSEQMTCQTSSCPVNGGFSLWSTWSACTKTCNTGQQHRIRTCTNPAPVGMGRSCVANSDELSNCNESPCPVPISAFAIYGAYPTYSSTGVAVFSSVKLNIGGHYSTTTGKYICHFPGIYVFSLNLYKKSGASTIYCDIRKNGSGVAHASVPSQSSGYYESSASTVLRLARGDTVDVGSCGNPSNIDNYTSFIGFLLKAD